MRRWISAFALLLVLGTGAFAAPDTDAPATPTEYFQAEAAYNPDLARGIVLYFEQKYDESLPVFDLAVAVDLEDPNPFAWRAASLYRLRRFAEAVFEAEKALRLQACHGFAHEILAEACDPRIGHWEGSNADKTWLHLRNAVACDSTLVGAWMGLWTESLQRGDRDRERQALRALIEYELLTPAMLAYTRWTMDGLPENAIFLTYGDMDTYPFCALQEVEGRRRDVDAVNLSLLNLEWYRRMLWEQRRIPLPTQDGLLKEYEARLSAEGRAETPTQQILADWQEMIGSHALDRPLTVAMTVDKGAFPALDRDRLQMAGAYYVFCPDTTCAKVDTAGVDRCLQRLNPDQLTGPMVSVFDRSPVRVGGSAAIAMNPAPLACIYLEALLGADRMEEADEIIAWTEDYLHGLGGNPRLEKYLDNVKELMRKYRDSEMAGEENPPD
jgi:tetratricopeptide (TPR) repeat protein